MCFVVGRLLKLEFNKLDGVVFLFFNSVLESFKLYFLRFDIM